MKAPLLLAVSLAAVSLGGCTRLVEWAADVPRLDARQAKERLSEMQVLDLRPRTEFESGRIAGAINVPWVELNGYLARSKPDERGPVLLVAERELDAALAHPTARLHGARASVLAGGMAEWRALGLALEAGPLPAAEPVPPPVRPQSRSDQLLAAAAGDFIKPTYMILAFIIARALRRAKTTSLRLLFHGALWFFVGEFLCAVNFFAHSQGRAYPIDLLHGMGMVAMSALIPWGFFRLLDDRVLRYSDPEQHCAVQRLCGHCWKRNPVRCAKHDLMLVAAGALAFLALMPFSAPLRPIQYVTSVFDYPVDYGAPIVNHLVELRLYPLLGFLFMLATMALLLRGPKHTRQAEPVFFVGLGLVFYPLLRFSLLGIYREQLHWSDFWEESTELLLMAGVGLTLYLFRKQLGLTHDAASEKPAEAVPSP